MTSALTYVQAWPFLVARGRREGYRTLLAPDFLVEHEMHEKLSDSTPSVKLGALGQLEVGYPGLGSLALRYTTEGNSSTGGGNPTGPNLPTDEHGRPLEILYGVIAREPLSDTLGLDDLTTAREAALKTYRKFLDDEEGFVVDVSDPYPLPRGEAAVRPRHSATSPGVAPAIPSRGYETFDWVAGPTPPPPPESRPVTRHRTPSPRRPVQMARPVITRSIVFGVVAVLVAVLAISLIPTPSRSSVRIIAESATPANGATCRGATRITLRASLRAPKSTRVRYHWAAGGAQPGSTTDTAVTVSGTSSTITDTISQSVPGPYRLVIDQPVRVHGRAVECRSGGGTASTTGVGTAAG